MLKVLVKVFKSLYLLARLMDLVDALPAIRYWSKSLHFIPPPPHKVTFGLRNFMLKFLVKVFKSLNLVAFNRTS